MSSYHVAILILKRGDVFFREYIKMLLSSTVAHHFALSSWEDMSCCSYTHHDYKCQTELECKHVMCRALHGTLVLF